MLLYWAKEIRWHQEEEASLCPEDQDNLPATHIEAGNGPGLVDRARTPLLWGQKWIEVKTYQESRILLEAPEDAQSRN